MNNYTIGKILSRIKFILNAFWNKLSRLNDVVGKISSYTIFIGVIMYIYGSVSGMNLVTDEMIWEDIKKQIPANSKIVQVLSGDLHGYNNNSIVVALSLENGWLLSKKEGANEILIFDAVDSDFLKLFYRPFKIGSSYIIKYKMSLDDSKHDLKWDRVRVETAEFTGDGVKDLIIYRISQGVSDSMEFPVILSWVNGKYQEVGTFPSGYNRYHYLPEDEKIKSNVSLRNKSNDLSDERIQLNGIFKSFRHRIMDVNNDGTSELVIFTWLWDENESKAGPHRYRIDVYEPMMNEGRLSWLLIFSKTTPEKNGSMKYLEEFFQSERGK